MCLQFEAAVKPWQPQQSDKGTVPSKPTGRAEAVLCPKHQQGINTRRDLRTAAACP